jgi:hypothetical protein
VRTSATVVAYEVNPITNFGSFSASAVVNAAGYYFLFIPPSTNVSIEVDISGRVNGGSYNVVQYVTSLNLASNRILNIVIPSPGTIVNISGYDISLNYTIQIQLTNNYMT